jgi:hypothetical protein
MNHHAEHYLASEDQQRTQEIYPSDLQITVVVGGPPLPKSPCRSKRETNEQKKFEDNRKAARNFLPSEILALVFGGLVDAIEIVVS